MIPPPVVPGLAERSAMTAYGGIALMHEAIMASEKGL
jgi:hypothetical protein